jgi:hypothetical protein
MKKDKGNKEMIRTIVFVVGICLAGFVFLHFSKALDDEGTTMRFNAESICFIGGYYDGLSYFSFKGNHTYEFVCDTSRSTQVEFNGIRGLIRYAEAKE